MIEDDSFLDSLEYFFEPRPKTPPLFLNTIQEDIKLYIDILELRNSLPEIPFKPERPCKQFYIIPSSQQLIHTYLSKIEEITQVYEDYCIPYPTSDKDPEILLIWLNPKSIW